MQLTSVFARLGRNDARIIGRDQFLITLVIYGLIVVVGIRLALPPIAQAVLNSTGFDLQPYYPLIISAMVLHQVAALLGGTIMGFLLIDERDDNTITALMVTPLPMSNYLLYRVIIPAIVGFLLGFVGLLLMSGVSAAYPWQMLLIALVNAIFAAAVSILLATAASNKVEGFAMLKVIGSLLLIVFAAWFIPEPWQYLFGAYPPYWTMKAFWALEAGNSLWGLYLLIAAFTQIGALVYLVHRFTRVIYTH